MKVAARLLVALVALFFLVWGLRFYVTPQTMAAEFFVTPLDGGGLSTVRGDLGGAFVAIGAFAALGLRRGYTRWLAAAAAIVAAVAFGRVIGFVVDGPAQTAVVAFVVELIFIAILTIGARVLRDDAPTTS